MRNFAGLAAAAALSLIGVAPVAAQDPCPWTSATNSISNPCGIISTRGEVAANGSGDSALVAAAPTSYGSFLLLRSGQYESVILSREATTNDFVIKVGQGNPQARMRILSASNAVQMLGSASVATSLSVGTALAVGTEPRHSSLIATLDAFGVPNVIFPHTPANIVVGDSRAPGTGSVPNGTGVMFSTRYSTQSGTWPTYIAAVSAVRESATDGNYAGALVFGTRQHGSSLESMERMRISSTGAVTIGRSGTLPAGIQQSLHVYGPITSSAGITAVYQDLAEWVPATTPMAAGTVVILNPDRNNEVMPSSGSYDTTVAGVVSAQPGLLLGVPSESKAMVATTGRVKVKVDASAAPIKVGDLLVTSDRPGLAMKSQPIEMNGRKFHQPGTILGKALEPLASGQGEILVLLSMQ